MRTRKVIIFNYVILGGFSSCPCNIREEYNCERMVNYLVSVNEDIDESS